MAEKRISLLTEDTAPSENSDLILDQPSGGLTRKAKLINLLKNVFGHKDVWKDYIISGMSIEAGGGGVKPTFANFRDGLYLWSFPGSGTSEVYFTLHLQHDTKQGADMYFHVHWAHNTLTPTGNVKWNLQYSIAKCYGISQFQTPISVSTIQAAHPTRYTHQITTETDIVISGSNPELEPDAIIIGRLFRNADDVEDTFSGSAFLLHLDIHYQASRVGTTERNRPFTSGGFPT